MTLSALMKKGGLHECATAATEARGIAATVAGVATVAVANPPCTESKPTTTLTASEENAIRAWLKHINETAAAIVAVALDQCRADAGARGYFIGRSGEAPKSVSSQPDDRRTCRQCINLRAMVCLIAQPGGPVSAMRGYRPAAPDLLRRCEAFNDNTKGDNHANH